MLNPQITVDTPEHQREHTRADQNEQDEARQTGGGVHRLLEQIFGKSAISQRQ